MASGTVHARSRPATVAVVVAMTIGMVAVWVPVAGAASPPCRVTNLITQQVYDGSGSNLQTAIDQAIPGTRMRIRGVCVGNYTIGKDLTLIGWSTAAFPTPTLDGDNDGTVVFVSAGSVVLTDLLITGGGNADLGGGVVNRVLSRVHLTGSTSVSGNVDLEGPAVVNSGTFIMSGRASVSENVIGFSASVYNNGTFTMNGASSISGNRNNSEEAGGNREL
jgi:nitrous oxidase accessory protein NosD